MSSRFFKPAELVSPLILDLFGEDAINLFPQNVLDSLDRLRELLGKPIVVNNYGKGFVDSGLRHSKCETGAVRSRHKLSVHGIFAFDLKTLDMEQLVSLVKQYSKHLRIARIENPKITKTWLHVEISVDPVGDLVIFDP